VLRLRDSGLFQGDSEKPRPGRIEGLLRSDNRRHRFGSRHRESGTEQEDDRIASDRIGADVDDSPIERGERAWRGNVASLKGCHCQGFLRIAVIRHGLRAVRAAQIDGSGSRRSHDAIPLVINRALGIKSKARAGAAAHGPARVLR
jgi:hypothetical protein